MALIQPKTGFHTGSSGGNLDGITADYIIPVLHGGKDVTIVAADTTAGLYDACVVAKNYQNTTSVLCWRRTDQRKNGGFDFDALANNFSLSPEQNAELHWQAYQQEIPPELVQYKDILELIILNEIRGQNTDEPVYDDLHIGEYLGRFALHYRTLTDWRLLFFGFASGEPDVDVWEQPSMLDFLRLCGERPHDTGIALHEYSYTISDILDGYPYKIGRYQFLHDVCDDNGIARPRIVISEWGWALDDAPAVPQAMADVETVYREYAKHPNIAGGAIWWLGPDFGGIANKIQPLIKPLGEYIIATNYDVEIDTPQPPDGGEGGTVTTYKNLGDSSRPPTGATHLRVAWRKRVPKTSAVYELHWRGQSDLIPINQDSDDLMLVWFKEEEEEPGNPNPPSVVTLPKGALGVDISAYQPNFWDVVDINDVDFAWFRCSDGMNTSETSDYHDQNGVDTQFWNNVAVLHGSGKPWWIYHFLRENNVEGQISKVYGLLAQLESNGTEPRQATLDDGTLTPHIVIDVENFNLTNAQVKQFYDAFTNMGYTVGIYTSNYFWGPLSGGSNWWADVFCIFADYFTNNGNIPPRAPILPAGFNNGHAWQYSSMVGTKYGWTKPNLDGNVIGPYPADTQKPPDPPTPPPTGQTYPTTFMRGEPGIWRVIRRADGSGEDVWELPLMSDSDVRVKNANEGEWYEYRADGVYRLRDTSPAPDSQGNERLYLLSINGVLGGKIAPAVAEVGKTYSYTNEVQFKSKANCQNLSENSGLAPSTFLLKEVLDNYTFPETGFRVDRLYVTVQTGEVQLYAERDGRIIGWCGGGANQDNNVWGGVLSEVYYDRAIPPQEPPRFCS